MDTMAEFGARISVITGRIQSKTPNMSQIQRILVDELQLYANCRREREEGGWEQCDICEDRFKCWTAGKPKETMIAGMRADTMWVDKYYGMEKPLKKKKDRNSSRGNFG